MMTAEEVLGDAYCATDYAIGPYSAKDFRTGWACVLNRNGFNCLRFKSKPGAVMTTPAVASALAQKWNEMSDTEIKIFWPDTGLGD